MSSQKDLSLHFQPELFGANRMSSITYVFYSHSIALTALATVSAIHDLSISFTCRPRSASLPLLLSDGENSSSGTSPPKQFSSWNKRPHPPTPHPLYSRRHPIREWGSCDSSSYCITAKGNNANPDNFYHHGWEKLGLTISETLLLKYREW